MARPVKHRNAKAPVPAAGVPSGPGTVPRRSSRAGARLRRSADIALVVLGLAAIGLFVATRIIGGRTDAAGRARRDKRRRRGRLPRSAPTAVPEREDSSPTSSPAPKSSKATAATIRCSARPWSPTLTRPARSRRSTTRASRPCSTPRSSARSRSAASRPWPSSSSPATASSGRARPGSPTSGSRRRPPATPSISSPRPSRRCRRRPCSS